MDENLNRIIPARRVWVHSHNGKKHQKRNNEKDQQTTWLHMYKFERSNKLAKQIE